MSSVHSLSETPRQFTRIRPKREEDLEEGSRKNIEGVERVVSLIVGPVMICGLFQQSWIGCLTAMIGTWLVYRGVTGHCPVCSWIATTSSESDDVEEGSEEEEIAGGSAGLATARPRSKRPLRGKVDWSELEDMPRDAMDESTYRAAGSRDRGKRAGRCDDR